MAQAAHEPTEQTRQMARTLSGLGVPQDDIAILIGVTKPTLHKYYRDDLDRGLAEANAKVASSLFQQATSGVTSAAIFWMKARAGWREKHPEDEAPPIEEQAEEVLESPRQIARRVLFLIHKAEKDSAA